MFIRFGDKYEKKKITFNCRKLKMILVLRLNIKFIHRL